MKKKLIIRCVVGVIVLVAVSIALFAILNAPASGTIEERYDVAQKLAEEGKVKKAANTYKSIVKEDGKNIGAVISLSEMYKKMGKYDDAVLELKNAISRNPDETRLYDALMSAYRESGDALGAIQYVESMHDYELRQEYMGKIYDRSSDAYIGTGNTMGNLANDGLIAFDDNAIYYSDLSRAKQLVKIENGEKIQLTETDVKSLNIIKDNIYFISPDDGSYIYKINKDGSGLEQVGNVRAMDLIAIGDTLFFINLDEGKKVYSMNADGSDLKKVSDRNTDVLYAHGSQLYICHTASHSGTYSISMDGKREVPILVDNIFALNGIGDMLFYRKDTEILNIWRSTRNGTEETEMNNARSAYINTDRTHVFYVDFGDEGTLHKMSPDGSENIRISSDKASYIALDGDYVYYFNKDDNKKLYRVRKDGSNREPLE